MVKPRGSNYCRGVIVKILIKKNDLPDSISGAIWYCYNGVVHGGRGTFIDANNIYLINGMGSSQCVFYLEDYSEEGYSEALIYITLDSGNYLLKGYLSYYVTIN